MAKPGQTPVEPEKILVPFPRITGMVRLMTHDVRNGLNNVDLQAAYLQELVTDPQAAPEVKRLRRMISDTAKMLQAFSASFWVSEPHLVTYSARMFVEDLRMRLEKLLPEQYPQIKWTVKLRAEAISVDIEMIFRALAEVFKNAFHFREGERPIEARAGTSEGRFVIELVEGKTSLPSEPETWGCEPLVSTRRAGFGMGLFYARRVLDAHHGEMTITFDPGTEQLTTRVVLPLAAS